jgi:3-hydroxy acid dehydrogenase/malonic semialdehyde reductase
MAGTEFSAVRFSGDKTKADAVYAAMQPLTADDIAESVYWAAKNPRAPCIRRRLACYWTPCVTQASGAR